MTKTFIQTLKFTKKWEQLNLTDDDLRKLELEIMKNPKIGKVIRGTGKLRKMRLARNHIGKSGSVRICYINFTISNTIYLITVYAKNEKENLSRAECNNIKKMIHILEQSL